jgi:hypothetical protein
LILHWLAVWITCFTVADYVHVFAGEALASVSMGLYWRSGLNEIHYLCFMISKIMIAYGLIVISVPDSLVYAPRNNAD